MLLADDLIATGGTAEAVVKPVESIGGDVVKCCVVIDLPDLGGRKRLEKHGHTEFVLCEFEGDRRRARPGGRPTSKYLSLDVRRFLAYRVRIADRRLNT